MTQPVLDVHTDRSGYNLVAWLVGGETFKFKPPFTPFYYTSTPIPSVPPVSPAPTALGTLSPVNLWKREAACIYDLNRWAGEDEGALEALKLVDRLVAEGGFDQSTLTFDALNVLAFDGEMRSEGQFPNPHKPSNVITDYSFYSPTCQRVISLEGCSGDEVSLIERIEDTVARVDPDVLLDYSGTGIDYEYLDVRSRFLRGRGVSLGRDGMRASPFISRFTYRRGFIERTDTTVYLSGRACLDVCKEAMGDQSLIGVRKRLKVIARRWFPNLDVVEVDYNDLKRMGASERAAYCLSDARACYMVGEVYLRLLCVIARTYNVPLTLAVHRRLSHLGNWSHSSAFRELGIVSDGSCGERWERDLRRVGFNRGKGFKQSGLLGGYV